MASTLGKNGLNISSFVWVWPVPWAIYLVELPGYGHALGKNGLAASQLCCLGVVCTLGKIGLNLSS